MCMACDCDQECEPNSGPELMTRGASKVLGVRVTKGFARELSKACSAAGCTQSDMIRLGLAKLAKASDDPDAQLTAVRDALGLDPDAGRASILAALDAAFAIVGDQSTQPVDPNAGAADPQPRTNPLAASKLNPDQLAALARRKLPATAEAWAALAKSMVRQATAAAPARAAAPGARRPAAPVVGVAKLSKDELAYCAKHGLTPAQFEAKRGAAVRVRRSGK